MFLTRHRCFHQTVLSLVHIINLSNIHPMRVWSYWKTRVFEENTGVGLKTSVRKCFFLRLPPVNLLYLKKKKSSLNNKKITLYKERIFNILALWVFIWRFKKRVLHLKGYWNEFFYTLELFETKKSSYMGNFFYYHFYRLANMFAKMLANK